MHRILLLMPIVALTAVLAAGCASSKRSDPAMASSAAEPCAECLVCKKNADLACVDVTVDENTPKYEYAGKTYFFCSDDCKDAFARNPAKYVKN